MKGVIALLKAKQDLYMHNYLRLI